MAVTFRSITLREIQLPLREPFTISSGTVSTRRILLLHIDAGDGLHVWSEGVAGQYPNYSPETIDTMWFALSEWIAPRVIGHTFPSPQDVHDALQLDFRGHNMAKAAVEMAAWTIEAEQLGSSLSHTLGGTRSEVATGISLGIQPNPAALVEKARAARAEGYQKIKIKVGPDHDIQFIAAVRETLNADAPIMADANNAYTVVDFPILEELDDFDLVMIEQPLAWDDVVRHAELQKLLKTPICLDESITNVERVKDMIALQSGRIVNIKPGRVGGFTESKRIHDLCAVHEIPVWCGGMLESGIGRAYNVALASLNNFVIPGDISPSARYWERDIVTPEWTMDQRGMVTVPDAAGIGVTVDENRIDDVTVRTHTLIGQ